MTYRMNFGMMLGAAPPRKDSSKFRLAVLGDFSARANAGQLATGDQLAQRKPLRIDFDNFDDVLQRLGIQLSLPLGSGGGAVQVAIRSLDDFHPDELYDNVELFSELSGLRQQLKNKSTFAKAAQQVQSWLGDKLPPPARPAAARGTSIPADCKLSDFARLSGQQTARGASEQAAAQLIRQVVAAHVVPAADPQQAPLLAAVDAALADAMRSILHHPDFQTLEAIWRSLDFLVRRLETGPDLEIVLYDVTAEEFAADLSQADQLESSGLYRLLVEQPALDAHQGPLSVIVGNYIFEQTPPHAELLGRMARLAAAAQAPFVSSLGVDCLKNLKIEDVHPLILESWSALRALPESAYLALTLPRFLLRTPYGERGESIDRFEFEEFTMQMGLRAMLWGNSALLAGLLLGQTYSQQGLKKMNLGSILSIGEMPYYFYEDEHGDQVALPCTERMINVQTAEKLAAQRLLPVLSIRGRPEVRLAGFQSLGGKPLAGPWAPVAITPSAAAPAAATPAATAAPAASEVAAAAVEQAAGEADAELDAMLAALGTDSPATETPPSEPPAASPAAEAPPASAPATEASDELDALLASLGTPEPESSSDDGMDPDLAALLADLG